MKQILFLFVLIFFAIGCGEKESAHIINIDSLVAEYSIDSSLADIDSIEIRYYAYNAGYFAEPRIEQKDTTYLALAYIHYKDGEYHIAAYWYDSLESEWIKRGIDFLKISNDTIYKLVELQTSYRDYFTQCHYPIGIYYFHPIMIIGNHDIVFSYQSWFVLDNTDIHKISLWMQDNNIRVDTFKIYNRKKFNRGLVNINIDKIGGHDFDTKLSAQYNFSDDSANVDTIQVLSLQNMWFRHYLMKYHEMDFSLRKRILEACYNFISDSSRDNRYYFSPDLKILKHEEIDYKGEKNWRKKMIPALPESIPPLLIDSVLTDYEAIQKRMDILEISGLKDSVTENIICFYTKEKLDKMLEELEKDSLKCSGDK